MNKSLSPLKFHRINITLPQETVCLLDDITSKGERSRLVNEAVRFYVQKISRANIRKRLQEGAISRAERDLRLTRDWFSVEDEIWQKNKKQSKEGKFIL